MNSQKNESNRPSQNACPNCGCALSPWQQVLLSIDRALVCKKCRRRIILDITGYEDDQQ